MINVGIDQCVVCVVALEKYLMAKGDWRLWYNVDMLPTLIKFIHLVYSFSQSIWSAILSVIQSFIIKMYLSFND